MFPFSSPEPCGHVTCLRDQLGKQRFLTDTDTNRYKSIATDHRRGTTELAARRLYNSEIEKPRFSDGGAVSTEPIGSYQFPSVRIRVRQELPVSVRIQWLAATRSRRDRNGNRLFGPDTDTNRYDPIATDHRRGTTKSAARRLYNSDKELLGLTEAVRR